MLEFKYKLDIFLFCLNIVFPFKIALEIILVEQIPWISLVIMIFSWGNMLTDNFYWQELMEKYMKK
jgi:hypothetical protein